MAGLSGVLNIAKGALLTHQLSVQVAAHNVANADTPGYTRQTLGLTTPPSTPMALGSIGNGVSGESITRHYDQFMTKKIMDQNSTLNNLEAQQQSLRVVETIFNEAPGLGINDLMNQFWESWQDLSDNPEILSTRQTVVQKGQALTDQLHYMNGQVLKAIYDIGITLDTAVDDVNSLTQQIAELNTQITSTETPTQQANDLRDQRDQLVKDLSEFLDITYFESSTGSYTVLLADGHTLVDANEYWQVDWLENKLNWLSTGKDGKQTSTPLNDTDLLGGKIGGSLEIRQQLTENDPDNYLGRLNAFANALIREVNQAYSQGVGLVPFSEALTGTEEAGNSARLTTTVAEATATDDIAAGTISINDREIGKIEGATASNGLAMGKAYNAVAAINEAVTGVSASLTTLAAGGAVTAMTPAEDGDIISFSVNGIDVSYTVDTSGPVPNDTDQATFAANLVTAVNNAVTAYNADIDNPIDMSVEAVVGDGTNGGALNSVVLRNTNEGDDSRIVVAGIDDTDTAESGTGLTDNTYNADAGHNTGEITLFATTTFTVSAGTTDVTLEELGMGGGLTPDDTPDDGEFSYSYTDPGGVTAPLAGFYYAQQLDIDSGDFDIWLYNSSGSLALPQPVTVSLARAYNLQDAADAINDAVADAGGGTWLVASVEENRLKISPDSDHSFAFANDTSNFLQVAGLNTFFSGYDAASIAVNETAENNLDLVAAARVTDEGAIYSGDNTNALSIIGVQGDDTVSFTGSDTANSLDGFYNSLISEIGNKGRSVDRDYEFNDLITSQMNELRDATSGVSLDEEMADLIKFQNAYSAAAKLISISDEMMVSLLDTLR